jgi:hypothetical protein
MAEAGRKTHGVHSVESSGVRSRAILRCSATMFEIMDVRDFFLVAFCAVSRQVWERPRQW